VSADQAGTLALFFFAGGWVAWLFGGTLLNRRRAAALSRWAYRQAEPYGAKLQVRWTTLAAFELTAAEAKAPFRRLSLTGLLESREMPFVWLWNRLRGRRDLLVVRAEPRKRPLVGVELFGSRSVLAGDARRAAEQAGWSPTVGPDGLWRAGNASAEQTERLLRALDAYAPYVERLAVRVEPPQIVVALSIGRVDLASAPPLGRCVARLAEAASRRGE
jgi:hypothetical protein